MPAIKLIPVLAACLCLLRSSSYAGEAEATPPTNSPPLKLKAEIRDENGPGQLEAKRAYLAVGAQKLAFLMPDAYHSESASPQSFSLANVDLACLITCRILSLPSPETKVLTSAVCRELLSSRYSGATILEEFTVTADNRSGPAFDLRWKAQGGLERHCRVVYILLDKDLLEVSLVASPEKFETGRQDLNRVLVTFRTSGPDGKLQVAPLSDKL
jgi:hypothetical protein